MLTGNEYYVVIKLNTGEQIMGVLETEDENIFQIVDPMIIRTIPVISEGREHITAHPYCQFTDDNVFDIDKKNVIFIKPLKEIMIPHYKRIVMQHVAEGEVQQERISPEEARERIKMLVDVFGQKLEDEYDEDPVPDEMGWFVEGNDTKH
jgi:hypothetical protein